jgi:hypothetical protein
MKQIYKVTKFKPESLALIRKCDEILRGYIKAGYTITVRTLYYQCVARGILENTERNYKNLTGLINDARMSGLIDWDVIEDRGRRPVVRGRWGDGKDFMLAVAPQYHTDLWDLQEERVFVVVEKDALAGVLERTCHEYDVPLLAAKGYPSASSVRDLVRDHMMRFKDQHIVLLHLGDHDPSGLDMSRDLEERLRIFGEDFLDLEFKRIALNMDQVEEVNPPPNPAKVTDSRFENYQQEYGDESWELDALTPEYLNDLLRGEIDGHIDGDLWKEKEDEITDTKAKLLAFAETF